MLLALHESPEDQSVLSSPIQGSCYTISLWNRFREQKTHKHCVACTIMRLKQIRVKSCN